MAPILPPPGSVSAAPLSPRRNSSSDSARRLIRTPSSDSQLSQGNRSYYTNQGMQTQPSAAQSPILPLPGSAPRFGAPATVRAYFGSNLNDLDQNILQQQLDQLPEFVKSHLFSCVPLYKLHGMPVTQAQQFLNLVGNIVVTTENSVDKSGFTGAIAALRLAKVVCEQRVKKEELDQRRIMGVSKDLNPPKIARDMAVDSLNEVLHVPHEITHKALEHFEAVALKTREPTAAFLKGQTMRVHRLFAASKAWQSAEENGPEALEWLKTSSLLEMDSQRGQKEWECFDSLLSSTAKLGGFNVVVRIVAFLNQLQKTDNYLPEGYAVNQSIMDTAEACRGDKERWECFKRLVTAFRARAKENMRFSSLSYKMHIRDHDKIVEQTADACKIENGYTVQQLEESGDQALSFSGDVYVFDCLALFRVFLQHPRKNLLADLTLLQEKNLKIPSLISWIFRDYSRPNLEIMVARLSKLPIFSNNSDLNWSDGKLNKCHSLLTVCRDLTETEWDKALFFLEAWCKQNTSITMSPNDVEAVLNIGLVASSQVVLEQSEARRAIVDDFARMITVDNTAQELCNLQMALSKLQEVSKDTLVAVAAFINKCAVADNAYSSASHRLKLVENYLEYIEPLLRRTVHNI